MPLSHVCIWIVRAVALHGNCISGCIVSLLQLHMAFSAIGPPVQLYRECYGNLHWNYISGYTVSLLQWHMVCDAIEPPVQLNREAQWKSTLELHLWLQSLLVAMAHGLQCH